MADDRRSAKRWGAWYARLLRLYPERHRQRFGEGMQQTFNDLCRERSRTSRRLTGYVVWMFAETLFSILRETMMTMATRNKRLFTLLAGVACLLMVPMIAMRFTQEVNWSAFDFLVAGALLVAACLTFEFFARRAATSAGRVIVGIAVFAVLVIAWIELAVGIFGSPWAGS
jgi:hypothetical protein